MKEASTVLQTAQEERDRALFDRIAGRYARKDIVQSSALARRHQLFMALRPLLTQTTSLGVIVDIGCGLGASAKYLTGYYTRYIGIDHSAELVKAATLFHEGNPNVEFIAADILNVNLPPHTADLILSDGGLHHMPDLDTVMTCLRRLAKPGAWFVAREPQNGNPFIQSMRWLRGRLDGDYSTEQQFFSETQIRELCRRHGLQQVDVSLQGFFIPPFAQVILNPQAISVPLSRLANHLDHTLNTYLPRPLRRLSFNLVVIGRFP
jgi:SAM-dependent methyltransferase